MLIAEFNRRDVDRSGGLCRDEIATFLKEIGWTEMTAEEIFSHYAKKNDEHITVEEFIAWQRQAYANKSESKGRWLGRVTHILKHVFQQHDESQSKRPRLSEHPILFHFNLFHTPNQIHVLFTS